MCYVLVVISHKGTLIKVGEVNVNVEVAYWMDLEYMHVHTIRLCFSLIISYRIATAAKKNGMQKLATTLHSSYIVLATPLI